MSQSAQKLSLKNGLRVILVPRAEALATTVLVMVETGSKYETAAEGGLSHFLEHMCFKGTERWPTAQALSDEFDSLGAHYNAFTSHEYTGYYASVEPRQTLPAIRVLADMYLRPLLPEAEIEKEKGVITQEIKMYEDQPRRRAYLNFLKLVYGDQPAGREVTGTIKQVESFRRADFVNYLKRHYVADKTIITVSGKFERAAVLAALKREFAAVPVAPRATKVKVKERQLKPALDLFYKKSEQAHLVLGFRAYPANHPDYFKLQLLGAILGGGMGSRLWQKVREELGAAYYVSGGQDTYTDHGLLRFTIGADVKRAPLVVRTVLAECARLKEELVPLAELDRVKQSLVGDLVLGLETSSNLGMYYVIDEIVTGKLVAPQEAIKQLRSVTAEEVRAVAKKVFTNRSLNLAVAGPFKDQAPFVKALSL